MDLKAEEEFKLFLQACMKLLCNKKAVENLQALIDNCTRNFDPPAKVKDIHKLYKHRKRTGREMRLTMQIGDYEMDQVILDLGSDANVLPKQTWERMGELKLEWSTIQLGMDNQQKIIPLGRLSNIMVDIAGVRVYADFELIQIVDDADPYHALLGLD